MKITIELSAGEEIGGKLLKRLLDVAEVVIRRKEINTGGYTYTYTYPYPLTTPKPLVTYNPNDTKVTFNTHWQLKDILK